MTEEGLFSWRVEESKCCCSCPWKKWQTFQLLLKSYLSISLGPICGKVLERLLYNSIFEFFIKNNLIIPNQSGFKTCNSCIYQLIWITHKIHKSFYGGYKVRGVFLDISKTFDKVWLLYLHYKLRQYGI